MDRRPTRRIAMSELRPCDNCSGPLLRKPFQIIRVTQAFMKTRAVREQVSLAQFFDGGQPQGFALADVMGAQGDDMVLILGEERPEFYTEIWVCHDCHYTPGFNVIVACEKRHETLERQQRVAATAPA